MQTIVQGTFEELPQVINTGHFFLRPSKGGERVCTPSRLFSFMPLTSRKSRLPTYRLCCTDAFPFSRTKQMFRTAEKPPRHRKHAPFHDFRPCIIVQAYQPNLNSRADDARKVAEDQPQLLDTMMSFRISQVLQPPLPSSPVQAAQNVFS